MILLHTKFDQSSVTVFMGCASSLDRQNGESLIPNDHQEDNQVFTELLSESYEFRGFIRGICRHPLSTELQRLIPHNHAFFRIMIEAWKSGRTTIDSVLALAEHNHSKVGG